MKRIFITLTLTLGCSVCSIKAEENNTLPQYEIFANAGAYTSFADGFADFSVFPTAGITGDIHVSQLPFYIRTGLEYVNRRQGGFDSHSAVIPALISYRFKNDRGISFVPFFGEYIAFDGKFDDGIRTGISFMRGKYTASIIYDLCLSHGIDDDSFTFSVGYNIWKK